jgi:lysophospholipase L1-like esterase
MLRKYLPLFLGEVARVRGYENLGPEFVPIFMEQLQKVKAGTDRLRLLCNGDSTTRGVGSGTGANLNVGADLAAYPLRLSEYIASRGVTSLHNSWVGAAFSAGGSDSRLTVGAGWSFAGNPSLGGAMLRNEGTTSDPATWDFLNPFTNGRIYYVRIAGAGQFQYDVDGGSATPVDTNGGTSVLTSEFSVARGIHSINLSRVSGGAINIIAVETWDQENPGIDVFNAGHSGADITQLASAANPFFSPLPTLGVFAAHLVILQCGINDAIGGVTEGAFKTAGQSIINRQRNVARGDIILMSSTPASVPGGEEARRAYARYHRDLSISNGVPFVDVTELMGSNDFATAMGWKSNGLHVNAAAYIVEAALAGYALPGI